MTTDKLLEEENNVFFIGHTIKVLAVYCTYSTFCGLLNGLIFVCLSLNTLLNYHFTADKL